MSGEREFAARRRRLCRDSQTESVTERPSPSELREWAARLRLLPDQSQCVMFSDALGWAAIASPASAAKHLEALADKYEQDYVEDARQ